MSASVQLYMIMNQKNILKLSGPPQIGERPGHLSLEVLGITLFLGKTPINKHTHLSLL